MAQWRKGIRWPSAAWWLAGGLLLWMSSQILTPSLQSGWLVNWAVIEASNGLFARGGPDERQLEASRQAFYRAMDVGYDRYAVLQRLREIESSRWYLFSQELKQQGRDWERVFSYQEWTRIQFDRTILDASKSASVPNWYGLGKAAERMQLWSLAAYFYRHALTSDSAAGALARLCYGQALLQSGQPVEAEKYLADFALDHPADQAKARWLLTRSLVAQSRYTEAASLLQTLAVEAPNLIRTAEGAGVARQIEAHVPVTVPADLRSAWAREAGNLLANGGFEDGYTGWGMWPEPGTNNTIDDQRVYSGIQSFRVQFDGSRDVNYYQVSQSVAVQPGRSYRVSAWLWAEQMTGQLSIEARGQDWFGGMAGPVMQGSTNGWQRATVEFQVPSGIGQISVTIVRYGGNGLVSGTIWVDDIAVEPLP